MRKYLGFTDPVIPTSYAAELVKLVVARGQDEGLLLSSTEISPAMLASPKARVSFDQLSRQSIAGDQLGIQCLAKTIRLTWQILEHDLFEGSQRLLRVVVAIDLGEKVPKPLFEQSDTSSQCRRIVFQRHQVQKGVQLAQRVDLFRNG